MTRFVHILIHFTIYILLGSIYTLRAQEVGIITQLSPAEIKIGEVAAIDITVRTNDLPNTLLIVPPDSAIRQAEMLALQVLDTVDVDRSIQEIHARMLITSFDSTLVVIPALGVRVGSQEKFAQPLTLKVLLPKVDLEHPEEYYDIKPAWHLPYSWQEIMMMVLPWLILALLLFLVGWAIRQWLRRRKRRADARAIMPQQVTPTLWEAYQKEIQQLRLTTEAEEAIFYTALDQISRNYIERIAGLNALEMTSTQLLRALVQHLSLSEPEQSATAQLLTRTDLAKYAKSRYPLTTAQADREAWLHLVHTLYQATHQS